MEQSPLTKLLLAAGMFLGLLAGYALYPLLHSNPMLILKDAAQAVDFAENQPNFRLIIHFMEGSGRNPLPITADSFPETASNIETLAQVLGSYYAKGREHWETQDIMIAIAHVADDDQGNPVRNEFRFFAGAVHHIEVFEKGKPECVRVIHNPFRSLPYRGNLDLPDEFSQEAERQAAAAMNEAVQRHQGKKL